MHRHAFHRRFRGFPPLAAPALISATSRTIETSCGGAMKEISIDHTWAAKPSSWGRRKNMTAALSGLLDERRCQQWQRKNKGHTHTNWTLC